MSRAPSTRAGQLGAIGVALVLLVSLLLVRERCGEGTARLVEGLAPAPAARPAPPPRPSAPPVPRVDPNTGRPVRGD